MANLSAKDISEISDKFYSPKSEGTPFFTPEGEFGINDDDDDKDAKTTFFMDPKVNKFPKRFSKKIPITTSVYADLYDPKKSEEVSEYIEEIMDHLFDGELQEQQPECKITSDDINLVMFSLVVDWLFAVWGKFKLKFETFLLTVWYLKYCLSDNDFKSLRRNDFQLLGCACMHLAAKVEETYNVPSTADFVYISAKAFTKKELVKMENEVLKTIQFRTNMTTPFQFYKTFSRIIGQDSKQLKLTEYLLTYICLDFKLLCTWLPSQLVAGCIYLAEFSTGNKNPWNKYISEPSRVVDYIAKEVAQDVYDSVEKTENMKLKEVVKYYKNMDKKRDIEDDEEEGNKFSPSNVKLVRPEDDE